jgi:hypothetical protein
MSAVGPPGHEQIPASPGSPSNTTL